MSEATVPPQLKGSARRVQQALAVAGFDLEVREFPTSTRTPAEAAAAIGCAVAQIAKSLIFRAGERSEEHTSELQSLMRTSYAVFCLKKQKQVIDITMHKQ